MHYELADMAAAQGVTDLEKLGSSDLLYSTPSAAEILKEPIARGYTSESTSTRINADVNLAAALQAAMPKAAIALAKELEDEELTVPAVLTVVDGKFTEASYVGGDLLDFAEISSADIRKAGLSGEGVSPEQAFDLFSSLEVRIKYGEFGQKVEIVRPRKDEVADFDLATMGRNDTITCEAAEQ
jgi:hypothetical protein